MHISAGNFDLSRRLKPWLFTIAANKARDAMRSRSRRQAAPLDAIVAGGSDGQATYASLIPANVPSPEDSLLNSETRRTVQEIVKGMPENLRLVLALSYFHEFPYKEIAAILEVPLGTVKSRLHAAVKHFAKQWQATRRQSDDDRESQT